MAYRDRSNGKKTDPFDFCILEVLLTNKSAPAATRDQVRLVTVDNHLETIQFVQNNLAACVDNIAMVKRTEETSQKE